MLKMRNVAWLATSVVAALAGSGCSNTLSNPASSPHNESNTDADVLFNYHTKAKNDDDAKHKEYAVKRAMLQTYADQTAFKKARYNTADIGTPAFTYHLDKDFDTWDRVFNGFQLKGADKHVRVQQFIRHYSADPAKITHVAKRSGVYMHMIVSELDKRNMPTEIALLPFVESAFNPEIFSHAGAAGLWQFIPETGRRYGLAQAGKYDARLDPIAATDAALDYLQKLQKDFNGDWLLALAAYNCGEGRVQQEINNNRAQGKPTTFWNLSLPRETMEYVPRLLAFKELISQSKRYGIDLPEVPNESRLAQLRLDKAVDLRKVAEQAGLSSDRLTKLNPYFRTGVSMPRYCNRIILPREHATELAKVIENMPAIESESIRHASRSKRKIIQARHTPHTQRSQLASIHHKERVTMSHTQRKQTTVQKSHKTKSIQFSENVKVYTVKPRRSKG